MAAALWSEPAFIVAMIAVLGLVVGSFLNVVIARLPVMLERQWRTECRELSASGSAEPAGEAAPVEPEAERPFDLVRPRSRCPGCGAPIRAVDNVPILSWLLLHGRCRACGEPISVQYPLVELLSALLAAIVVWHYGAGWTAVFALVFTWTLLAAAVIDLRTTLLPDDLTLPLLWLGLLAAAAGVGPVGAVDAIVGAAAGYLLLWALYHGFRLLTGKEGMGYGDFKLLAALGAWVGWQGLPVVVLLSSAVGAAVGIAMITLRGHDRAVPIPFGPYLAAGGWIALLWGQDLVRAYVAWALG